MAVETKTKNRTENVPVPDGYSQVCIWQGILIEEGDDKKVEEFIKTETGCRVKFLEVIFTNPNRDSMLRPVKNTGGRSDVFLAVHKDDIGKFAVPRLRIGLRWIEDVMSRINGYIDSPLYPQRVEGYKTWDC